jgi:hypothetical protein
VGYRFDVRLRAAAAGMAGGVGAMTPGQIAQLQELTRCYMPRRDKAITLGLSMEPQLPMNKWEEAQLRRLWHQYRGQIRAMQSNRKVAG